MLRILTIVCLVGVSSAHMGGEAMLKRYAQMKIMQSCLGEETVINWKMQMKAACDKCKGQDVMQTMIDIQAMLKDMRKKYNRPITRSQQPVYVPVPVPYMPNQFSQIPQFQQFQQPLFRNKRSFDLSAEGIKTMREKIMTKISNVTCVLKEMNYLTADNQLNYATCEEEINNLSVDDGLKEDLMEAMDMCRDFAMCMPVEKAINPIKKELGTAMAFMKCMHMKKIMVCMKTDIKKYAPMMGYEGDLTVPENENMMDEIISMITEGDDLMF